MRYPYKFREKLSYSTVAGVLSEEFGYASAQTWTRRRWWRLARQKHPDFLVATVHGSQRRAVEGWTDTPDHQFSSVVVRSEIGDDVSVWTEIRDQRGGFTLFRLDPGQSTPALECRSGRMLGWSTVMDGRVVNVLHPEHLAPSGVELKLVSLQLVSGQ